MLRGAVRMQHTEAVCQTWTPAAVALAGRRRGVCGQVLRARIACAVLRANPPACFLSPSEMPPHSGEFGKTWVGADRGGIPCVHCACLLWQLYHGRAAFCARPFIFYTPRRLVILRYKPFKVPDLRCTTCTKSRLHTLYGSTFRASRLPVFKIGKLTVVVAAAWIFDQIAARWYGQGEIIAYILPLDFRLAEIL